MGGGSSSAPPPPDPWETAQAQAEMNRQAMADSARFNQIGEQTPYGSTHWEGAVGSADRRRVYQLHPVEQSLLDQQRYLKNQHLGFVGKRLPLLHGYLNKPLPTQAEFAPMADKLEQATYDRGLNLISPGLRRQQYETDSALAARGISIGSMAQQREQNRVDESRNNLLENLGLSSVAAGRAEQQRLFGNALATRQQYQSELASILGAGGPTGAMPPAAPAKYSTSAPDYMGQVNANYQTQMQAHQQRQSDLWGGLFGVGKAAIGLFSDRRLKENITRIGTADNGLAIYSFNFKMDTKQTMQIGFMADEVEKIHPDAVTTDSLGWKRVDYRLAVV